MNVQNNSYRLEQRQISPRQSTPVVVVFLPKCRVCAGIHQHNNLHRPDDAGGVSECIIITRTPNVPALKSNRKRRPQFELTRAEIISSQYYYISAVMHAIWLVVVPLLIFARHWRGRQAAAADVLFFPNTVRA